MSQILDTFYDKETFYFLKDGVETSLVAGRLKGETAKFDIVDKEGNVLVAAGKRITAKKYFVILKKSGLERLRVDPESLSGSNFSKRCHLCRYR